MIRFARTLREQHTLARGALQLVEAPADGSCTISRAHERIASRKLPGTRRPAGRVPSGANLLAVVNLGQGSGVYDRTFTDPAAYDSLLAGIRREASEAFGGPVAFDRVTLAGFSAGHGAIRAILRDPKHFEQVDSVLLLDGLHTSYVPRGRSYWRSWVSRATRRRITSTSSTGCRNSSR